MSKQLKPCPFCGHTVIKTIVDDGCHWEQCQKCEATGPAGFKRGEEGDLDWNSRALLAQPNTCTKDGGQCEPVAEIVSKFGDPEAFGERELVPLVDIQLFPYGTKLYQHPPAQAPVVLPGRKQWGGLRPTAENLKAEGWNAYDDEFKRLNPTL